MTINGSGQFRRIATEEAFSTPNIIAALQHWASPDRRQGRISYAPFNGSTCSFQIWS
ncbi:hypothetical protein LAUMK41_00385 [Mycobacterium attenuatum]|nr:hypothetical protein LAUMK41_00385 [Mycobacterium attenuatum]